ncbi:MAG: DUF5693 family protein [Negativicutes bacterium]|nr:DUF5693 family protein [Negativicutes bacterium]
MLNFKRLQKILILLIILSMLPVWFTAYERIQTEGAAKSVEISLDTEEIYLAAAGYGGRQYYLDTLAGFRAAGATSATLYQKTFEELEKRGDLTVLDYAEAADALRTDGQSTFALLLQNNLKTMSRYVITDNLAMFAQITSSLSGPIRHFGWRSFQNEKLGILEIPSAYWEVYKTAGLWYDQTELQEYLALGFLIEPRPAETPGITAEQLRALYQPLIACGKVSNIIATGKVLPGTTDFSGAAYEKIPQDGAFNAFVEILNQYGWNYGLVENATQLDSLRLTGDSALLQATDFQAVRVYSIQRAELDKKNWLTYDGIAERWQRAAVDRNMRIMYLRLFSNGSVLTAEILSKNQAMVKTAVASLENSGYTMGAARSIGSFHLAGRMVLLPLALALSAVLFFMQWGVEGKTKYWLILTVCAAAAALAIGYLARSGGTVAGSWVMLRQLLAFAAQVLYPVLAGMFAMRYLEAMPKNLKTGGVLFYSVKAALGSFLIAINGGILLGILMSDNNFMLELQYFRGVKAGFILPLLILGLWFFLRYGYSFHKPAGKRGWLQIRSDIKSLFGSPISVMWLTITGVAAFAAYYYLLRSGNAAVSSISPLELQLRAFLEKVLVARPRIKEFLIGYPASLLIPGILAAGFAFLVGPLLAIASVGWVSVVNSFAHVRSGMMIAIERGLWGILLGVCLGLCAYFVMRLALWLRKRYWEEPSDDNKQTEL